MKEFAKVQAVSRGLLTLGVVAFLVAAGPAEEMERLQGTWNLGNHHHGGRDHKDLAGSWLIKGNAVTITTATARRGTISLDTTKTPGRFEKTDFDYPTVRIRGTFRLDGDTLKLYYPFLRGEPPVDLPDEPARGYVLEVWKRIGEKEPGGLDGSWRRVALLNAGNRVLSLGKAVMVVKGTVYAWASESQRNCTIKIDPSKDPKHLDITFENPPFARGGPSEPWVYRLDGDRLTIWESGIQGRPTEASNAPDSKSNFRVFERLAGKKRGQ